MIWSSEQDAIFSAVAEGASNLIVEAVAGSGKTTTLVEAVRRIPRTSFLPPSVLFLAFNKSIAETLKVKLGTTAVASTFHSLGLAALKTKFLQIKVDFKKAGNAIFPLFKKNHEDTRTALRALLLLKSTWPVITSQMEAVSFLANNDVIFEDGKSIGKVMRALETTLADVSSCDFDDMLIMPLVHDCPFPTQDFVLVDEAQDTNDVQLEILTRLQRPGKVVPDDEGNPEQLHSATRFLFVGDPAQAIYGFRGANSDSMERIAARFACESLPLSVTYRCPSLHVELAKHYSSKDALSQITARPNAPLGVVLRPEAYNTSLFLPGSVVLCRNTAPLVSLCYNLLSRDIPCRIAGKDLGAGLVALARRFETLSSGIPEFLTSLNAWYTETRSKTVAEGRSPEGLDDKYCALCFLSTGLESVNDLCRRIDRVFDDNPSSSVLLSTIHKFKGGEADRVFLLDFTKLLPSKYATRPWQLRQERNLQYVAVTRSKDTLIFIESDRWEDITN